MNWRSTTVAGLVDALGPTLPAAAFVAAIAADDGGYAVRLSDGCPLEGRFEIGSTTKTLTGTVLASLVNDGTVALDDEIGHWLDAGPGSDITLGQLATHTSGLPRLSPSHIAGAADPYDFLTAEAAGRELRLTTRGPRGVEWDYSNFGFQVLSLALERAASMPFGALLEQRVLRPLGMNCSGVAGHGRGSRVQGHAQGSPVAPWTHHLWGAGGVEATAEDLARYLSACLTPPDSAVGAAIRLAQRPHHRIDPLRSAGLGWALGPPGYLGHDGGTSGFRAMLGIKQPACRAAGVFVNDRAARGLPPAVRRALDRETGQS
ncbi:beta-lactamase family protein [Actinoallomurus sp. NBC_01490]|uniref:serine hydrolase domain-containing protein n=1 Tax=Actinoallomurus sp. NBC_01490 TaxID=2903557 RepID=UPI002E34BD3C|nr:serine hydrolase domain-containing protein [Actinoallomurus sp. NBC_01490]